MRVAVLLYGEWRVGSEQERQTSIHSAEMKFLRSVRRCTGTDRIKYAVHQEQSRVKRK
jgi:hypothetical protein